MDDLWTLLAKANNQLDELNEALGNPRRKKRKSKLLDNSFPLDEEQGAVYGDVYGQVAYMTGLDGQGAYIQ